MPTVCPLCRKASLTLSKVEGVTRCTCNKSIISYRRYPAYDRPDEQIEAEKAQWDNDATCMNHVERKAVAVCNDCGIFMCGLCATDDKSDPVCISCYAVRQRHELHSSIKSNSAHSLQWDNVALLVAIVPIFMWYFTWLTAIVVLVLVAKFWKKAPYGIVGRGRTRLIIAGLIAIAQLVGWVLLSIFLLGELL